MASDLSKLDQDSQGPYQPENINPMISMLKLTYCRNTNFQCFAVTPGVRSRSKYFFVTEGRFSSSQCDMFSSSRKICSHTSLVSVSASASAVAIKILYDPISMCSNV